jgi:hypothetical protein
VNRDLEWLGAFILTQSRKDAEAQRQIKNAKFKIKNERTDETKE